MDRPRTLVRLISSLEPYVRVFRCRVALALALGLAGFACPARKGSLGTAPSGVASAAAPASAPSRTTELLRAEDTRDATAVSDEDLASPSLDIRRAAVRTLARAADPRFAERLQAALADGDPEVLAWAAYGIGQVCEWNRDRLTRALAARAGSLSVEPNTTTGMFDPWFAIARALGECATPEAERTLVAWLEASHPRAAAAAFGLGDIASRRKRIEEETAAGLLRAVAGDAAHDPLVEALYPFGRLKNLPPRAVDLVAEHARSQLEHPGPGRLYAIRALGKTGDGAVEELARIAVAETGYSPAERAEAVRALGNLSSDKAQQALVRTVAALQPARDPVGLTALVGPRFNVLLAALEALEPKDHVADMPTFRNLAALPIPPQAPASVSRRVVAFRCAAAKYLANQNADERLLTDCDPDEWGISGALARLAVLNRAKLKGKRLAAWRNYLAKSYPSRVREAGLQLLGAHPEIPDTPAVLAEALESPEPGIVAVAAEQISQYPDRAYEGSDRDTRSHSHKQSAAQSRPFEPLVKALLGALERQYPPDAIETVGEIAKAAAALQLDAGRTTIEALCKSPSPTLRSSAQTALGLLTGKKVVCEPSPQRRYAPAVELEHLLGAPCKLRIESDAGELRITLDPKLAPIAATRIADLARRAFFDGIHVHRVVPGFVVQFGDPQADGYGGAGLEPLRCETSPVPFFEGAVGIALAGRDTGSSQIFVTLASAPHLDGHYAVIGTAEGPWSDVADGDVIRRMSVVP